MHIEHRPAVPLRVALHSVALMLGLSLIPLGAAAQGFAAVDTQTLLPDDPSVGFAQDRPVASPQASPSAEPTILGTPRRILHDEKAIFTSPAHLHRGDLVWLLPLAGASAASLATDSYTMQNVVSRNAGVNAAASTSSDALRGVFIGVPILLLAQGELAGDQRTRETGLLAGEAMVDSYIASEVIKYATLRERPYLDHGRGHFFATDAVSDPSFVSGHSIVAWSSAAVLAGEYSKPWQQIGIYTLASGVSFTRVLAQQHFPTDVLLGSATGWLIGHYVYRRHR